MWNISETIANCKHAIKPMRVELDWFAGNIFEQTTVYNLELLPVIKSMALKSMTFGYLLSSVNTQEQKI